MVGLDHVLQDFLVLWLVSEVFKVADTIFVPEGIGMWELRLDVFQ